MRIGLHGQRIFTGETSLMNSERNETVDMHPNMTVGEIQLQELQNTKEKLNNP